MEDCFYGDRDEGGDRCRAVVLGYCALAYESDCSRTVYSDATSVLTGDVTSRASDLARVTPRTVYVIPHSPDIVVSWMDYPRALVYWIVPAGVSEQSQ